MTRGTRLHQRRTWRGHRPVAVLGALATVGLGTLLPLLAAPGAASAQGADNAGNTGGGSGSVAVVTPLLKFFVFGNTIGLPLLCSDASSVVSIFGAQTKTATVTSPLITQLDTDCSQIATQGATYLQQAIARSQALVFINPVLDPLITDLSSGLQTVGTTYGPSLAPFGPTVAGLGGTVAFFEGS